MKLQSIELISRYTQSTSRLLLVLSGGVFAIEWYDLNTQSWAFLDRSIAPSEFREIASVVLCFLIVSHIIHWVGDHEAYRKWFQTNSIPTDSINEIGAFGKATTPIISGLLMRLERLNEELIQTSKSLKTKVGSDLNASDSINKAVEKCTSLSRQVEGIIGQNKRIENQVDEIQGVLSDIGPGFRTISRLGWFVVYVWYLALPVLSCTLALISLWCGEV